MITQNFEETKKAGEEFAGKLLKIQGHSKAIVAALYGELGSGKTTFVQGMARGLGIRKRIISPTFLIVRTYGLQTQNSKLFYHIDLYRIQNETEVKDLGIGEIIKEPKNIVAVEWGEKMGSLLPEKRWDIKFEHLDEDERRITIHEE